MQTPDAQSLAVLQLPPLGHGKHSLPPQSISVSFPLATASEQLAGSQIPAAQATVPVSLSTAHDPTVVGNMLELELEALAAPRIEEEEISADPNSDGSGALGDDGTSGVGGGARGGVEIVGMGTVGQLDWTELEATSAAAFTDWLDERQFPYEPEATSAFEHYVAAGWNFVAFTISPSQSASDVVCTAPAPIELAFEATTPVIPARIVATDARSLPTDFRWQIYAIADAQVRVAGAIDSRDTPDIFSEIIAPPTPITELRFAGELTDERVAGHAAVAEIVGEGQWLTELTLLQSGQHIDDDVFLEADPDQAEFQRVVTTTVEVDCSEGCGYRAVGVETQRRRGWAALGVGLLVAGATLRRWRRRASSD